MTHKVFKSKNETKDMLKKFNVLIEKGEDGYLISEVLELPGCRSQAKTKEELLVRTKEAAELYLTQKPVKNIKTKFLDLEQLEIEV